MDSSSSHALRVGIVGVGNCASSFIQGLTYYSDARGNEPMPGLMNADLGGYHVSDVEISAAFDINTAKVGLDVAEAIYAALRALQKEWAAQVGPARFATFMDVLRELSGMENTAEDQTPR